MAERMSVSGGRRRFLAGAGFWLAATALYVPGRPAAAAAANIGPLAGPDANGLRLPAGFTSRIVARSGWYSADGAFPWHAAPDGGACFPAQDGGWIYVSNSELPDDQGGAGALRFNAAGGVMDSYPILTDTNRNCAGGATPWGTWLSCEEVDQGLVWECDPTGQRDPVPRPALGAFAHEAVAVDPLEHVLYLTEDHAEGRLYRFMPTQLSHGGHSDISYGRLDAAHVDGGTTGRITWHKVPDPSARSGPLREQVKAHTTAFNRGEGICYHRGKIYFTTTGDNRVWRFDPKSSVVDIIYDGSDPENAPLRGVDNVTATGADHVLVAEDGGSMQIAVVTPGHGPVPLVQVVGHEASEVAGPAFDPSGKRLYFSSQRGATGKSEDGVTYEITGPFPARAG